MIDYKRIVKASNPLYVWSEAFNIFVKPLDFSIGINTLYLCKGCHIG